MITVLSVSLAAAPARAEPARPGAKAVERAKDKQRARALYDEGLRHYNVAEYPAAIDAFKEAYLLSGDPELLFDVAQAYRLSGDCEQALRFYKNFLRENPHAANLTEVNAAVARCEQPPAPAPRAVAPAPVLPPPAPVERPLPAVEPPPPAPLPLAAGPVDVERGAEPPAAQPGRNKRVAGVTVGLVGATAAATGVVLGLSARARLNELHGQSGEWTSAEQQSERSSKRMATAGQILTGVGATTVVAGLALYLLGASEQKSAPRVAVAAGPGEASLVWACGF
jgi:tetratricopeptide (TPR) repeat protein